LAQPLVPSTSFADAWIQIDRTDNPRFFVNLLDATRARLLERARTSPGDSLRRWLFAPDSGYLTLVVVRGTLFG
jgi:hypothetical protein